MNDKLIVSEDNRILFVIRNNELFLLIDDELVYTGMKIISPTVKPTTDFNVEDFIANIITGGEDVS